MKKVKIVIGQPIVAMTDGINSKKVTVKVLQELKKLASDDYRAFVVEYPKGKLDILVYSDDELTVDHDVSIEEILSFGWEDGYKKLEKLCSKYKLECRELLPY